MNRPHPLIPPDLQGRGRILTGERAHWCFDWDGLPIDETTPEMIEGCCSCTFEDTATTQDEQLQIGTAFRMVSGFFKNDAKTYLWFRTANPLLGNIAPIEMIGMGRVHKLLEVIQAALNENAR